MTYTLPSTHTTPRVFRVRTTRVWESEWFAKSREEAIAQMVRFLLAENPAENATRTTAKVVRVATPQETAHYYGNTIQSALDAMEPGPDVDDDEPF